jgi:hypothetical protein
MLMPLLIDRTRPDDSNQVFVIPRNQPSTLAPISNIESLDFCAISESESNVVLFKFVCEHNI